MKNRPLASGCLILFLLMMLSVICGGARFIKNHCPSVFEEAVREEIFVRLSGQVYDIDVKDNYRILYLKNNSIIYQNKSFKESKIIVYDEKKLNIEIGNQIEAAGELSLYERERNPGNFNQKLYYQKQGVNATVWASEVIVKDEFVDRFWQSLYSLRTKWKDLLYEIVGDENGAILSAILLAEKSGINEETKELYQVNGIGHILAISGLHLSVIGVGMYKIFRRLSGSFVIGGTAGISFLLLYILMIGISVSVLRAFIMFLFQVGADIEGRHYDSFTALSVAVLVTVIWNPLYLMDGGFWLSYGAILAVILVFPMFENLVFQSFWASVSINLVTLPVLLYYFYEIPLYSVFLNMIVIPLMTATLICGLAGSLWCAIFTADGLFGAGGIGGVILKICGLIFDIYDKVCQMFLKLPGNRLVAGQSEIWQIVVYYVVLLIIIVIWWQQKSHSQVKAFVMGIILFLNVIIVVFPNEEMIHRIKREMSVTVLDVGQGDGIFIRGPKGHTYLIDGGSSDIKKVGKYRIEPFLKSQGISKIDYVFVSHGDGDHTSGIREMIERMDVGVAIETMVFPDKEVWDESLMELARFSMEKGVGVAEMRAGQVFTEGKMNLTCLVPVIENAGNVENTGIYEEEGNVASMVLALSYGKFDMLFCGDVEDEGEKILTKVLEDGYQEVKWEGLKVAHHGSKNSSTIEFLNIVQPLYSFVSAGRGNAYGHPHMETIERLEDVGSTVFSTQDCGAITIVTDGEKMKVEKYLEGEK